MAFSYDCKGNGREAYGAFAMQLIPFSYNCKGNWGGDREAVLIKSFYHAVDFTLL